MGNIIKNLIMAKTNNAPTNPPNNVVNNTLNLALESEAELPLISKKMKTAVVTKQII